MPTRTRYRVVIPQIGTTWRVLDVPTAPQRGIIRRVRATIEVAEDSEAALGGLGAGAELELEVHEGGTVGVPAVGLGGPSGRSVVLTKPIGAAPVGATFDLGSGRVGDPALEVDYTVPAAERLRVAIRSSQDNDALSNGVAVVTLTIEPHAA